MLAGLVHQRPCGLAAGGPARCSPGISSSCFGGRSVLPAASLAGAVLRPHALVSRRAFPPPRPRGLPAAASSGRGTGTPGRDDASGGSTGGQGWGRSEGRSGPGRGGGRPGGRGGGGARREHLAEDDPDRATDLRSLAELAEKSLPGWKAKGKAFRLSTTLNRAVKMGTDSSEDTAVRHRIFDTLAGELLQLLPTHQLRSVADCTIPLYACAKAGYWRGGFVQALLVRLSAGGLALLKSALTPQDRRKVSDQNHANLWWSLSVAPPEIRSTAPLQSLLEASAEGLMASRDLSPQAISNVVLACARMQWSSKALLDHLTASLAEARPVADCQALANSLYALGELAEDVGHTPQPDDLQGLAAAVTDRLSQDVMAFKPQELTNMLLGCAKLGISDPDILRPLAAAAAEAAPRMEPQHLANSLYSLALLQPSVSAHGKTAEALAQECKRRHFTGFTSQAIASSAWALAKMGYADQGWYAGAVEAAGQPGAMKEAMPQAWSNLWYALALVRHQPTSGCLLERTIDAAFGVLQDDADSQTCSNLLWALANLRLYDTRLVDALTGRLGEVWRQDPEQLTEQGLCNSLWALAVMGPDVLSRHSGLVEGLLRDAERRWAVEGEKVFNGESVPQLWYVQLELAHVGGGELQRILGAGEGRQGSLLGAARAAAERRAAQSAPESRSELQLQVASALERLAERLGPSILVSAKRGCVVPGLGRAVDVVVELAGGRRVAVEVDGPSHFLANRPRDPAAIDGSTELRNRQLGRVFGQAVTVSFIEWDFKEPYEQEEVLCRLLGISPAP